MRCTKREMSWKKKEEKAITSLSSHFIIVHKTVIPADKKVLSWAVEKLTNNGKEKDAACCIVDCCTLIFCG